MGNDEDLKKNKTGGTWFAGYLRTYFELLFNGKWEPEAEVKGAVSALMTMIGIIGSIVVVGLNWPLVKNIFLGGILILALYYLNNLEGDRSRRRPADYERQRRGAVFREIFTVVRELADILHIKAPIDVDDLVGVPEIVYKGGLQFVNCTVSKLPSTFVGEDVPLIMRKRIQSRINKRMYFGQVEGIHPNYFDVSLKSSYPLFFIDSVKDDGLDFSISVLIVDNVAAVEYMKRRVERAKMTSTASPKDVDF